MVTKLESGDVLTQLKYGSTEFWIVDEVRPQPPYTYNGVQVSCVASTWDVTGNDEIDLSNLNTITDSNGVVFRNHIGPRPRNIVKR